MMAISVDSPEDSENLRRSQGYTFPILSDAQEDVIRWDLMHLHDASHRLRRLRIRRIKFFREPVLPISRSSEHQVIGRVSQSANQPSCRAKRILLRPSPLNVLLSFLAKWHRL